MRDGIASKSENVGGGLVLVLFEINFTSYIIGRGMSSTVGVN